jgi:predicted Zn finger-like uncharacterized protein
MLIVCPSCGIKYNVPASYLTKDRTLKCAGCGTSWVVKAVQPTAAEAVAPSPVAVSRSPEPETRDHPVATPSESVDPQTDAVASAVVSDGPPVSSVTEAQPEERKPEVSQEDEQPVAPETEMAAAPEEPSSPLPPASEVLAEAAQPSVSPETGWESSLPQPVAGEKSAPFTHEASPRLETPVQNEEHDIRQESVAEPEIGLQQDVTDSTVANGEAALPSVPKEERTPESETHSEALSDEAREPVTSQTPDETEHETFSTVSELPTDQHFSTRITPRQEKMVQEPQDEEAGGFAKPFSFLDLPVQPSPVSPPVAEAAPPKKNVAYRSIWDDEPEPAPQQTGFGTKHEEESHEWHEKDLDEHFNVGNTGFSGSGHQDESLLEDSKNSDRLKDVSGHPQPEPESGASRNHAEESDASASPAPQDATFDDVIMRLRAARNNPGSQESLAGEESTPTPAPKKTEHSTTAPWVPVWDRVAEPEQEEAEATAPAEDHHDEAIWEHEEVSEGDATVPSGHIETAEETEVEEEPAATPRHVTPAIDISSRLRSDVLKRTEQAEDSGTSFLESAAFWRKAWLVSGVGTVVALAACAHWFSALRHLWPALNLL